MPRCSLSQAWSHSGGLEVLIQEHHVWVLCLERLKFLGVWTGSPGMTDPPLFEGCRLEGFVGRTSGSVPVLWMISTSSSDRTLSSPVPLWSFASVGVLASDWHEVRRPGSLRPPTTSWYAEKLRRSSRSTGSGNPAHLLPPFTP